MLRWFKNFKITTKLLAGFLTVALFLGGIGVFGIFNLKAIEENDGHLYNVDTLGIANISKINSDFLKIRLTVRNMVLFKGENISKDKNTIEAYFENINSTLNSYKPTARTDEEKAYYDKLVTLIAKYEPAVNKIASDFVAGQSKDLALKAMTNSVPLGNQIDNLIGEMSNRDLNSAMITAKENKSQAGKTIWITIIIVIVGFIVSVILGSLISSIINKGIKKLMGASNKIAVGDMDIVIDIDTKDEIGELANSYNKMIVAIKALITDSSYLAEEAIAGRLDARADISKHNGDYQKIIKGVNNTLDAITEPLNESRSVLASMAVNDLTVRMKGSYNGFMKEFSEDINHVNDRLNAIVDLITQIAQGETKGLEGLLKIGRRSENDRLMPMMIVMMTTIKDLVLEVTRIADAAGKGNLETRSSASKFEGGYREVLEGFNNALDAIAEPINEAAAVLEELADGNLDTNMVGDYTGSYKIIKSSINHVVETFNDVIGGITETSDQVSSGSRQVSDGSQALAQGATEQASSVEELTAAITQVAAQTRENAINANEANELALNAKEHAEQGNEHMNSMLNSMKEINESSGNISKIIKVIDDIAFQTNILALNAAVEAARAGQHGKGFAVVAEEVRNLAARSANAAKETTTLIEGSIKKVETGTNIANETAKALVEIVEGVTKAATLVGHIANASNEQASAISQINKGVEQVSMVVQTNSATAEESAAASEELSSQAAVLMEMISKFNLKRDSSTGKLSIEENSYSKSILLGGHNKTRKFGFSEAATTRDSKKSRIALSDNEFGKY